MFDKIKMKPKYLFNFWPNRVIVEIKVIRSYNIKNIRPIYTGIVRKFLHFDRNQNMYKKGIIFPFILRIKSSVSIFFSYRQLIVHKK